MFPAEWRREELTQSVICARKGWTTSRIALLARSGCVAMLCLFAGGSPAQADESAAEVEPTLIQNAKEAAAIFDTALEHFEAAQYEAAARAFLRADLLAPDPDTLNNALIAAKKSSEHLLVTRIAQRALQAHQTDPGLVARARTALAAAAIHLASLTVSCLPAPCHIYLDGERAEPERMYVSPGTHRISATRSEDTRGEGGQVASEKRVTLSAGTTYVFEIKVPSAEDDGGPGGELQTLREAEPSLSEPSEASTNKARVGRVIFYSGLAITGILAGVTTWSGVDATRANQNLPAGPNHAQVRKVDQKILRTDILLGTAVASATFTVCWGLWATDFRPRNLDVGVRWEQGPRASLGGIF